MGDGNRRDGDGILGRWSRRKQAARGAAARSRRGGAKPVELARATPLEQPLPIADDAEARLPATRDQKQTEEKTPADLPAVDKLDKDSDFTQFLKKGVPEALKRQALKRLWTSDPQFHVVDPFTEYGGDYTVVVPMGATSYKPGIGHLTEEELEQQRNLGKDESIAEGEAGEQQAEAGESEGAAASSDGEAAADADAPSPQPTGAEGDQEPDAVTADGGDEQVDADPEATRDPDAGSAPGSR